MRVKVYINDHQKAWIFGRSPAALRRLDVFYLVKGQRPMGGTDK
jgi:hypothetical protein